jgi:hypothetical protein
MKKFGAETDLFQEKWRIVEILNKWHLREPNFFKHKFALFSIFLIHIKTIYNAILNTFHTIKS